MVTLSPKILNTSDIAEELNQEYESYGSATWRKPLKQAGLEAGNCFYCQNEALVLWTGLAKPGVSNAEGAGVAPVN